jgi:hypothetical protein
MPGIIDDLEDARSRAQRHELTTTRTYNKGRRSQWEEDSHHKPA